MMNRTAFAALMPLLLAACAGDANDNSGDDSTPIAEDEASLELATVRLEDGHSISFLEAADEPGLITLVERGDAHRMRLADRELNERLLATSSLIERYKVLAGHEPDAQETLELTAAELRRADFLARAETLQPPPMDTIEDAPISKTVSHYSGQISGGSVVTITDARNLHANSFGPSAGDSGHLLKPITGSSPHFSSDPGLFAGLICTPLPGDLSSLGSSILAWTSPLSCARSPKWTHLVYHWNGSSYTAQASFALSNTSGALCNSWSYYWTDFKWSKGCVFRNAGATEADFANFFNF